MTKPPALQAVVFDLDGLMFNTEELYQQVDTLLLARRGKPCETQLLDKMMGRKTDVALQILIDWHQLDDTVEMLTDEAAEIFAELLPRQLAPMPGLIELLDALKSAQIPKGIATSSSRPFVTNVLGRFQLENRFAFVLSGDDIARGKPEPDVYLLAAKKHGVLPERMMVLEDSQIGCRAATAAGTFAVAVPHGRSKQHTFPGVKFVADSLADLRIYESLGLPVSGK